MFLRFVEHRCPRDTFKKDSAVAASVLPTTTPDTAEGTLANPFCYSADPVLGYIRTLGISIGPNQKSLISRLHSKLVLLVNISALNIALLCR